MSRTVIQSNKSTKLSTMILGITLAIAGAHHGFFEILQGNTPTSTFLIQSIGPAHRFWIHGSDEAVTILPNFLATGIVAILISISIIVVCLFSLDKRNVSAILLALFILLTLFGGGIGHIPFFLLVWAFSRYMNHNLSFWRAKRRGGFYRYLGKFWPYLLFTCSLCFLIGLEISVFGFVPGITEPDQILRICWIFLAVSLILTPISYIAGISRDAGVL